MNIAINFSAKITVTNFKQITNFTGIFTDEDLYR